MRVQTTRGNRVRVQTYTSLTDNGQFIRQEMVASQSDLQFVLSKYRLQTYALFLFVLCVYVFCFFGGEVFFWVVVWGRGGGGEE